MAEYIGKIGLSTNISSTPIDEGFLYSIDDGVIYLDYKDSTNENTPTRAQLTPKKSDSVKSVTVSSGVIKVTTQDGESEYYTIPIFSGSSSEYNGSSGLVPAPQMTDINKYLKSDGTWSILPNADETNAGVVKLYTNTGENTDGTINQAKLTELLDSLQSQITELSTSVQTALDAANSALSVTDKYATMLNIIGNYK